MIALVTAALAAPGVDVLVAPAVLRAPTISARHEQLDVMGTPVETRLAPDARYLGGQGLSVAATLGRDDLGFVELGGRVTAPVWQVRGFTFAPVVTAVRADVGGMWWWSRSPSDRREVDGYTLGGGGAQVSVLSARPFTTAVAPALHAMGGLGVANRGPTPVRVELRADLAWRIDHLEGRAELSNGAFVWSWWPGEAGLSVLLGLGAPPSG